MASLIYNFDGGKDREEVIKMKKMVATRFFEVNPMESVATLLNAREALNDLRSDSFRFDRSIREVASVYDLDFRNRYCFIVNASGKAYEVDSLEEAKKLFSDI